VPKRIVGYVEPGELTQVDELNGQVRDTISAAEENSQVGERDDPVDGFNAVIVD